MGSVTEPAPGCTDHLSLASTRAGLFHSQMVALFFLSVALGTSIAGQLAELSTVVNEATYFGILGGIAIVPGAALWPGRKPVLRLMAGVR